MACWSTQKSLEGLIETFEDELLIFFNNKMPKMTGHKGNGEFCITRRR